MSNDALSQTEALRQFMAECLRLRSVLEYIAFGPTKEPYDAPADIAEHFREKARAALRGPRMEEEMGEFFRIVTALADLKDRKRERTMTITHLPECDIHREGSNTCDCGARGRFVLARESAQPPARTSYVSVDNATLADVAERLERENSELYQSRDAIIAKVQHLQERQRELETTVKELAGEMRLYGRQYLGDEATDNTRLAVCNLYAGKLEAALRSGQPAE